MTEDTRPSATAIGGFIATVAKVLQFSSTAGLKTESGGGVDFSYLLEQAVRDLAPLLVPEHPDREDYDGLVAALQECLQSAEDRD